MKLRIRGQSVRFRLSPNDIDALGRGETVKETLNFGLEASFVYGLVPADISHVAVEAGGRDLLVLCPMPVIKTLVETDDVGFERTISGPGHPGLTVLVEKDFQCLIPRGEDDGNTFPNPNATP